MNVFEIIEDNGGGLFLFVFHEESVVAGIENLEFAQEGEGSETRNELLNNPMKAIETWEGQIENVEALYSDLTSYNFGFEVVADEKGIYPERMGRAAQRYFGIDED